MRLFIMRHGPAEDSAPSGRDFDRELSARGRVRTERVAAELVRLGERPLRVLASPLLRAVQTAEIVAAVLGPTSAPEIREELAPSEAAARLVEELVLGQVPSALLVSHAPDVSVLAARLLGTHVDAFDTAMILGLDLGPGTARRRLLISPRALGA